MSGAGLGQQMCKNGQDLQTAFAHYPGSAFCHLILLFQIVQQEEFGNIQPTSVKGQKGSPRRLGNSDRWNILSTA